MSAADVGDPILLDLDVPDPAILTGEAAAAAAAAADAADVASLAVPDCDWMLNRARRGDAARGSPVGTPVLKLGEEALVVVIILLRRSILVSRERALPLKLRRSL